MSDNSPRYTVTNNTRGFNEALSKPTRPLAYANEIRPPDRALRGGPAELYDGSRREVVARPLKRSRQTLNLVSKDGVSPATLARAARVKSGLAVPSQHRPAELVAHASNIGPSDDDMVLDGEDDSVLLKASNASAPAPPQRSSTYVMAEEEPREAGQR